MPKAITTALPEPASTAAHDPTVSVIIPVYRHAAELPQAVASALGQDHAPIELIVVDDGPDDDVARWVEQRADPKLRLIRHERNQGAAAARNTGVANARGNYVAFLDADDEWLPGKLRRQVDHMVSHGVAVSTTGFELIRAARPDGLRIPAPVHSRKRLVWGCDLSPGTTLVADRRIFRMVGEFDDKLPRFEDWDWLLRYSEHGPIDVVPLPLARIHVGARPSPRLVDTSCRRMLEKHGEQLREGDAHDRRKFVSSLFVERASAALNHGDLSGALRLGLLSLLVWPIRNLSFYRRSFTRLLSILSARVAGIERAPRGRVERFMGRAKGR
ncbi:MAG: glycosyltransferase family 2 protein [Alphaproteobacteria bacterium]